MVCEPMDTYEQPQAAEETDGNGTEAGAARRTQRRAGEAFEPPRRQAAQPAAPGSRVATAIEAALVPRLVMLHGGRAGASRDGEDAVILAAIEPFTAALTVDDEAVAARGLLQHLLGRGTSFETICLGVMAPAARRLGAMWETDDCDFALVTLGLSRLQRLMRELDARIAAKAVPIDPGRVALLAVTPGEQHVLGIAMIGDFLRRAGWEIHDAVGASSAEIAQTVGRSWFCIAALSCGAPQGLGPLSARITAIRSRSRNRGIGVLVGGLAFLDNPEAAIRVGADAMAQDARAAVFQAERLLVQSRVAVPAG